MSGIERDVYIYARPKVHISDFFAKAILDENYENGLLDLTVKINNLENDKSTYKLNYQLFDDKNKKVAEETKELSFVDNVAEINFLKTIQKVKKWSAE
ncbi:MAG: hypothetical protein QM212_02515, partial [Bacteroidota bacterium]|nr:hypothetical protein [Bacteroidota bacterium]